MGGVGSNESSPLCSSPWPCFVFLLCIVLPRLCVFLGPVSPIVMKALWEGHGLSHLLLYLHHIEQWYPAHGRYSINTYWIVSPYKRCWSTMDGSPPNSSVHGILQARILEWVAIPFSRGSSQPPDGRSPHLFTAFFYILAIISIKNMENLLIENTLEII